MLTRKGCDVDEKGLWLNLRQRQDDFSDANSESESGIKSEYGKSFRGELIIS
jgi:hypothetical protein